MIADVSTVQSKFKEYADVSERNETVEERNRQLVLPGDGLLYSSDGRRFGIKRWRPKMEVGHPTSFEIECVEIDGNDYYAKQSKLRDDALKACAEANELLAKLTDIGSRVQK